MDQKILGTQNQETAKKNLISVLNKLLSGYVIILLVGILAYLLLFILMLII